MRTGAAVGAGFSVLGEGDLDALALPTPSKGREIYQRLGRIARRGREVVSGIRVTSLRDVKR